MPVALLESSDDTGAHLRLHGTVADFFRLTIAEEVHFIPPPPGFTDYDQALFWPYFVDEYGPPSISGMVVEDFLPLGEVDIRRGDPVHATDGEVGRVQGLVVTRSGNHVTHLLLQEDHIFGRKEVSIPITAVTSMSNGVELNLTRQQVRSLPSTAPAGAGA